MGSLATGKWTHMPGFLVMLTDNLKQLKTLLVPVSKYVDFHQDEKTLS